MNLYVLYFDRETRKWYITENKFFGLFYNREKYLYSQTGKWFPRRVYLYYVYYDVLEKRRRCFSWSLEKALKKFVRKRIGDFL